MKKQFVYLTALLLFCCCLSYAQEAQATFVEFRLKDVGTIQIPVTMELQGGDYKVVSDALSKEIMTKKGFDVSGDQIVFQQKGLNELKGDYSYARVMIATDHGIAGDYAKLNTKLKLTPAELRLLDATTKDGITEASKGIGIKILRWDGVSVVLLNGRSVIRTAYLRQLEDKPSVYVEMYQFMNYDRIHRLTISYRQKDEGLWKAGLERAKTSFLITNVR